MSNDKPDDLINRAMDGVSESMGAAPEDEFTARFGGEAEPVTANAAFSEPDHAEQETDDRGADPDNGVVDTEYTEASPQKKKINPNLIIVGIGVLAFLGFATFKMLGGANDRDQESLQIASVEETGQPQEQTITVDEGIGDLTATTDGVPSPAELAAGVSSSSDALGQTGDNAQATPEVTTAAAPGQPAAVTALQPSSVAPATTPITAAAPESVAQADPKLKQAVADLEAKVAALEKKVASLSSQPPRPAAVRKTPPKPATKKAVSQKAVAKPATQEPVVTPAASAPTRASTPFPLVLRAVTPGQAWIENNGDIRPFKEGDKTADGDQVVKIDARDRTVVMASGRTLR